MSFIFQCCMLSWSIQSFPRGQYCQTVFSYNQKYAFFLYVKNELIAILSKFGNTFSVSYIPYILKSKPSLDSLWNKVCSPYPLCIIILFFGQFWFKKFWPIFPILAQNVLVQNWPKTKFYDAKWVWGTNFIL